MNASTTFIRAAAVCGVAGAITLCSYAWDYRCTYTVKRLASAISTVISTKVGGSPQRDDSDSPSDELQQEEEEGDPPISIIDLSEIATLYSNLTIVNRLLLKDSAYDTKPKTLRDLVQKSHVESIAASAGTLKRLLGSSPPVAENRVNQGSPIYDEERGPPIYDEASRTYSLPQDHELAQSSYAYCRSDLELVLLGGDVGELISEPADSLMMNRIRDLVIVTSPFSHLRLARITSFHSLTRLALPAKFLDSIEFDGETIDATLLADQLEWLECIVFMSSGGMEARQYDDAVRKVFMRHIFSDRRLLALPSVPAFQGFIEDDPYIQQWEKGGDMWYQAEVYTERESSKLLRKLRRSGIHIMDLEELKLLYHALSAPRSDDTCHMPLNEDMPSEMIRSLTISPDISPFSVRDPDASTVIATVLSTLANHVDFKELEATASWVNQLDMVSSAKGPWTLRLSQWDPLVSHAKWPANRHKSLSQVDCLMLPEGTQADQIEWKRFSNLRNVSLPATDAHALESIVRQIADIRSSSPYFSRITLLSLRPHHPKSSDLRKCRALKVELVTEIVT